MDYTFGHVILEVTRRCNMNCAHCMRGEAQNVDMQKETVDKLLDSVSEIGHITFTGGEPTLNLPLIKYTFDRIREKQGCAPAFFVATNGKQGQKELMTILAEAYLHCSEPEACSVSISVDEFHEAHDRSEDYLRILSFYSPDKEHHKAGDWSWVLNLGNANFNGVGERTPDVTGGNLCMEVYHSKTCGDWATVEEVVVTADGYIRKDCDYAYNDEDGILCSVDELGEYLDACVELYEE